jgi:alpha-glucosidase
MLNYYRRALAFRRAHGVLRHGAMEEVRAEGDLAVFQRTGKGRIFCAFNLGEGDVSTRLPAGTWVPVGQELGAVAAVQGEVTLGPWGFCLMQQD